MPEPSSAAAAAAAAAASQKQEQKQQAARSKVGDTRPSNLSTSSPSSLVEPNTERPNVQASLPKGALAKSRNGDSQAQSSPVVATGEAEAGDKKSVMREADELQEAEELLQLSVSENSRRVVSPSDVESIQRGKNDQTGLFSSFVSFDNHHRHLNPEEAGLMSSSHQDLSNGAKRGSLISPPAGMLSKQGPGTVASTNRPGHNGQVGHNADTGLLSSKRTTEKATELPPRKKGRASSRKSLAQAGSPKGRNLSGTQNVVKKINNAPTTISPSPRLLTTTSTGGKGGTPGGVAKKKPQFTKQPPQKKQSTPGKKQQKKHDVQADEPPVVVAHPEQSPRAWAGSRGAKTAFSQQQRHRHQLLLFQQQQQQLLLQHRAATPSAPGDLRVGDLLPNFQVRTSVGKGQVETVTIHDYFGSQWGVLMTIAPQAVQECLPTCRQDVAMMTKLLPRFTQLNIKVAGTSVEEPEKQQQWLPSSDGRRRDNFGFFADPDGALSQAIGASLQPPHHQLPAWMVFSHKVLVISPGKQIRFVSSNVPVVARNFAEILRIVSCLQQFEIL